MESTFDKLIKESLQNASTPPPKDLWERIEGKLNAFEKPLEESNEFNSPFSWKYAAAAAISGIAVALSFLFFTKKTDDKSANNNLPPVKTNIEIGYEITPKANVVEVATISKPPTEKRVVATNSKPASNTVSEDVLVQTDDVVADGAEDISSIPVFSLKLNKPKTSSLNEKIKVISGEPMRVEVDENLNKRRIMIYQRLRLINQSHNIPAE